MLRYLRQPVSSFHQPAASFQIPRTHTCTLYIDQAESPSALRVTTGVGTMAPLHCTALGKVLLAFANAPTAEHLDSFTIRTITDHAATAR